MPNEIDELMDRDPTEMSNQDIEAIIAYQRKQRAAFESGTKKAVKATSGPKISLDKVMGNLIKPKAVEPIKRRF